MKEIAVNRQLSLGDRWRLRKKKELNRSTGGNVLVFLMLAVLGAFMALPIVYSVVQAFKPMEEIFIFPPRFTVKNPTVKNFKLIGQLSDSLWVPFSRYLFNSVFVSVVGTLGNVLISSMAAYPLARHDFPGKKTLFRLVTVSLLFTGGVIELPRYIVMAKLHMVNTYWALILPVIASPMGLFLMKQFMEQLPTTLMESARLDGASEFQVFWKIVMPNVKPAWLTLAIFQFQQMWGNTGSMFLRDEQLKPLQFALQQIAAGGTARAGASAAVTFVIAAVPIIFFLACQSNVLETMTTSGMKD